MVLPCSVCCECEVVLLLLDEVQLENGVEAVEAGEQVLDLVVGDSP